LSWSVSTEVSDVVGSGGITEILMDDFIAIAVARNFGISVEGVPETNAMSDFVGSSLESSSDVVGVHPKSSGTLGCNWVPWEGSDSEEGSLGSLCLSGDEEVEISGWFLGVGVLQVLDGSVPCVVVAVCRDGCIGVVGSECGCSDAERQVGSSKVSVDLVDLSVDLGLGERASSGCADDGDVESDAVCTSSP